MQELVFPRLFLPQVERAPNRTLVVDESGGHRAGYAAHLDRVLRLARALPEVGVARGDRFAVLSRNRHEYLELWHAAFFGAAMITPLNTRFVDRELIFVLRDAGVTVCFVDAAFADVVARIRDEAGIERVILIGEEDGPSDARYEDLLAAADPVARADPDEDDPVALMYTGGTTGHPKGVVLTQRAQLLNQYHVLMVAPVPSAWTFLQHAPMFHAGTGASVLRVPISGAGTVILPAFEPERFMQTVETHGVDFTVFVPSMIAMVLDHPTFRPERLATLRRIAYGGAPMPARLLRTLRELYPDLELTQSYGMTEASSNLTQLTDDDHRRDDDRYVLSVGRPLPGVRLAVRDADGADRGAGEVGELCVQAGNLMTEYWNRPVETAEALRDGWYHTGDLGYQDEAGYVFVVDRAKDMIVSGGENVYCAEVENAIASHPDVEQVAAVGVPDERWGEAVLAIVVLKPGADADEAALIGHAREAIAGYKVPKRIELRDEPLPLSAAGKVLKRELRAPYWAGRERVIG